MDHLLQLIALSKSSHASPVRGHGLAREAVELARSSAAGAGTLGRACLLQAGYSYRLFDYAESYALSLEAIELLERDGDARGTARAVNLCFIINIETGDFIRALDFARRAIAEAQRRGDECQQARLLLNQAVVFDIADEHEAAVRCLIEAVELFQRFPSAGADLFFARINLADVYLAHAERLEADGQPEEGARQRSLADQAIPDFDPRAPLAALHTWIAAKSRMGCLAEARVAAFNYLRRLRESGPTERYLVYALLALAEYHVAAGRADKAVCRLLRAVDKLRSARNQSHLGQAETRLAQVYAERGEHVQALRWQRQALHDGMRLHDERQKLRCRVAALERDAERRRARREEALLHDQRLAVIGRMLAQIYHALAEPIIGTRMLLEDCARRCEAEPLSPDVAADLREVVRRIDAAAMLGRQLKMFSYRAAPQLIELGIGAAVRDAWRGMVLWRGVDAGCIDVRGDMSAAARVDAQRLSVLLQILLIECERTRGTRPIAAEVSRTGPGVRLRLQAPSTEGSHAQAEATSVGFALCAEIAAEMQGGLCREDLVDGGLAYVLDLPCPNAFGTELA
jgi:tetratricopeptide (TPR) repeat protein